MDILHTATSRGVNSLTIDGHTHKYVNSKTKKRWISLLTITTNIEETKSQERNILDMLPINTQQEQIYDFNVFRFYGFECCK